MLLFCVLFVVVGVDDIVDVANVVDVVVIVLGLWLLMCCCCCCDKCWCW